MCLTSVPEKLFDIHTYLFIGMYFYDKHDWLIIYYSLHVCYTLYGYFIFICYSFSFFSVLTILFGSIVVGGYIVYGHTINPNILMSLGDSWLSYAAIVLMAAHLILGFIIMVKPVTGQLESFFNTPLRSKYHYYLLFNIKTIKYMLL